MAKLGYGTAKNGKNSSPESHFRKFKEEEKTKTIMQRIELNELETRYKEEKSLMENQIQ